MKRQLIAGGLCAATFLAGLWVSGGLTVSRAPRQPFLIDDKPVVAAPAVPELQSIALPPLRANATSRMDSTETQIAEWIQTSEWDDSNWFDLDLTSNVQNQASASGSTELTLAMPDRDEAVPLPDDAMNARVANTALPVLPGPGIMAPLPPSVPTPSLAATRRVPRIPATVSAATAASGQATLLRSRKPAFEPPLETARRPEPSRPFIPRVASREPAPARSDSQSASSRPSTKSVDTPWRQFSQSTEGRPLHKFQAGGGKVRLLVVAGLSGEDRLSIYWMDALARMLTIHPGAIPDGHEVMLVRAINPDGLQRNQRANSRNVDLDRNFPGKSFRLSVAERTGEGPASEVETRALLTLISQFQPHGVLILQSRTSGGALAASTSAANFAQQLRREQALETAPLIEYEHGGSLGDYCESTYDAAVLRLELDAGEQWQTSWKRHQALIQDALALTPASSNTLSTQVVASDASAGRAAILPGLFPKKRASQRGYEELPAPPDELP